MAWKGSCPVGERRQLVELLQQGFAVAELARLFDVSRKTAHKWIKRAKTEGVDVGLQDRSRARHEQNRFEGAPLDLLLEMRRKHRTWGPRTLLVALRRTHPKIIFPAASTVGAILKREGLIFPQRRQPRFAPPFVVGDQVPSCANDRWTADYKGQFRMLNGELCYPFTLRDAFSRMLLEIRGFRKVLADDVIERLTAAFEQFGLPYELQADNGSPFGSIGLARLSLVSVFLLKHGVKPLYSRPGRPQDNGGHERMHRDLKAEATRPPGKNLEHQQEKFDAFRATFNYERPHQALGGATPASCWSPARRTYVANPEIVYPKEWEVRLISIKGDMHWSGGRVSVSKALRHELVGLEPIDDGIWRLHFSTLCIGLLEETVRGPVIHGFRPAKRAA